MSKDNTNHGGLKPLPKPKPMPPLSVSRREKKPRVELRRPRTRPVLPPIDEDELEFPRKGIAKKGTPTYSTYQPKRSRPLTRKSAKRKIRKTYRWLRKKLNPRLIGITAAIILCLSIVVLQVWSRTTINALAIHVNGEFFAHIPYSSEIQAINIHQQAATRLSQREEARVSLMDAITIYPVNGQEIIPLNEAIERLADGVLSFRINATVIEVNGVPEVILRTQAEAEYVKERVKAPYLRDVEYYYIGFVDEVRLVSQVVDEEAISTTQEAAQHLTQQINLMELYTIRDGDNLGIIAVRHNTSIDHIVEDNHGIYHNSIIRAGNTLNIRVSRPFLSVRTIEIQTRTEPIPRTRRYEQNPNEMYGQQRVIDEGQDGEVEITVHVTRINGVSTGEEREHSRRPTTQMMQRVIEIGTMQVAAERR